MDRKQLIRRGLMAVGLVVIAAAPASAVLAHAAGWQPLIDRSASMAPTIGVGDLVIVDRMAAAAMRPGQIVTFADPHVAGRTLTHRVVAVRAGTAPGTLAITTRGDANRAAEQWTIARGGTVARLRWTLPLPAAAAQLLDRSRARAVAMALLALLCAGLVLRAIWRRPAPCAPAA